jgi:hypothetical protein
MRINTFVATAVLAALVAVTAPASAQQRWPSRGDGGNRGGGQQQHAGGGNQGTRSASPRAAAPRPSGSAEQPRARQQPQPRAERNDNGSRRADGRRDGRYGVERRAVPRTGPVPRYRDGDHRVYVQPRRNYYVYRYPSYRYYGYPRYYGYRYYDPYFSGDFFWSNHGWQARSYYYGSNWNDDLGKLRLDIDQRDAEVYIDGYYAGVIDDFDGRLQGLRLEPGNYQVEVAQPGYEPLQFDVHITPGRTTTYRGSLLPEP